jgi:hypothetical protein
MQVRALVSAADAGQAWDLRCRVREALIDYLQRASPDALPRVRAEMVGERDQAHAAEAALSVRAGKGHSSTSEEPTDGEVQAKGDPRSRAGAQDAVATKGG